MVKPNVASSRPGNEDIQELVSSVLTVSRALVAVSVKSLQELDESMTLPQLRTLVVLSSHGEMNLNRLAEILDVNASSAMRMVDRLLAIGLVTRRENPENRRHTLIGASDEGLAVVRKVTSRRSREIKKIVARMPNEDRESLVRALRSFTEAAEEPDADRYEDELSALGW